MLNKKVRSILNLISGQANLMPLEAVIFNLVTFFSTLVSLSAIGFLLLLDIDRYLVLGPIITTGYYFAFYYFGRFKGKSEKLALPAAIIILLGCAGFWFFIDGGEGPALLALFLCFIICITFLPSRHILFWILFNLVLVSGLVITHLLCPEIILEYPQAEHLPAFSFLILLGGPFVGFLVWVLKTNYVRENTRVVQKNEELNDFAHMVSHDMKAPLRAIQHLSGFVLEDNEGLDEEGKEMLRKVSFSANRMTNLINDILNYTRISSDVEDQTEVDLAELVEEVVQILNPTGASRITYSELNQKVTYNRIALHQILQNLISNALKYNDKDLPEVHISSIRKGAYVWISVKDNGPGIAPEHHAAVFEFLKTLGNKSRQESGSGIGLALVKKVVEQNGGEIQVHSRVGEGANFSFSVPVQVLSG